ncbi:MAG: hypothetical protein ACSHYB_08135 [Roseibacillus sp.]
MKFSLLPFLLAPVSLFAGDLSNDVYDEATESSEETSSWLTSLFSGSQRFDSEYEALYNEDIWVGRTSQTFEHEVDDITLTVNGYYTEQYINYTDPVGATLPIERQENTWGTSLTLAYQATDTLSVSGGGRYYDGFADYQSIWIAEYYDQFVGGAGSVAGYDAAEPYGWAYDLGVVWDYRRGGRLTASFSYGQDEIVPAWSRVPNPITFRPEPVPTRSDFITYSGSLNWEQALNENLKTQLIFRATGTTDRQVRYQLQNNWAWAMTDKLTLRGQVGATYENPNFEAYYGGLNLNYEIASGWHAGLGARIYHDSGEFTTAGFNTAAPELDSSEISASLAWKGSETSVRLSFGFFDSNYGALGADNEFFSGLYQDRHFLVSRLAISHQF